MVIDVPRLILPHSINIITLTKFFHNSTISEKVFSMEVSMQWERGYFQKKKNGREQISS